jgi:hypothetical protein
MTTIHKRSSEMNQQEHLEAVSRGQANAAMCNRNLLVSLWTTGHHIKALMNDCVHPHDIAEGAGIPLTRVYSALTVYESYANVRDIPND